VEVLKAFFLISIHSLISNLKSGTCLSKTHSRFSHLSYLSYLQENPRNSFATMKFTTTTFVASMAALAAAAPSQTVKRAQNCQQWGSVQTGTYTVYNNLWGQSAASSGSECFEVTGLSGTTVKWDTTYVLAASIIWVHRTLTHYQFGADTELTAGPGPAAPTASSPTPTPSSS